MRQGNVFTCVCHSVHNGGWQTDTPSPWQADTLTPGQTPSLWKADTPSLLGRHPLSGRQTPPWPTDTNFIPFNLNRLSFHIYRDGDLKKTRDSWGTIWQREISSVYPLLTLMNCNWGLFTLVKNGCDNVRDSTGPTKYQTRFPFRLMLVSPWTEKSPINYFLKQIKFCLNLKENAKVSKFTFAGCEFTRIIGMFVSCQWRSPSREVICFGPENSIGALYIIRLHGHPLSTLKNICYWLTWKEMVHSDIHDPWLILRLRFSQFSQTDRYRFTQEVLNTERYLSRNSILRPTSITTHF